MRGPASTGAWIVLGAALAAACGSDRTRLHVRTTLPAELRAEVEASFESAHPDVDVRFSGESGEVSLEQLRRGEASFDVWWGAPALMLEDAADEELLMPYRPEWVEDDRPGEAPGRWQPVVVTPFVLAFDRTKVPLADAPADWVDVFHHRWYDDVRLLDPAGTSDGAYFAGAMIVEALRDDDDLQRGFDWLDRLDDQVDLYGGDVDEIVRALGSGAALLAILPRAATEAARAGEAPWLHYRLPESGTPTLALGVGIVGTTTRVEVARTFVDHLGRREMATAAKLHTRWEPVAGDADPSALPPDFELEQPWTAYPLAADTLAAELEGWLERWELEVRGR